MVEQAFQEMLFHIVPWIAIAFGCLCITETLREKSMGREAKMAADAGKAQREMVRASYVDAAKASAVSGDKAAPGAAPNADKARDVPCEKHTVQNAVRAVVLAAAVIFLIHGIMNGSMQDVLVKAVNICTECIGLG